MIFDKNKPLSFVPIPRTASTAIAKYVGEFYKSKNIELKVLPFAHKGLNSYLYDNRKAARHSFAFVRNPYSRAVSMYMALCGEGEGFQQLRRQVRQLGSFEVFCEKLSSLGESKEGYYLLPQTARLHRGVKCYLSFIGCYECLKEDFNRIFRQLGFGLKWKVHPPKNCLGEKYKDFYRDDRTIKIVREFYQRDFDLLGYDPDRL